MLKYGFNLETLYFLQLDALYDIVRIIRDNDALIAPDKDVIIRGCIIPFLRDAVKAPESASKDEVLRLALIATAKKVGVSVPDWNKLNDVRFKPRLVEGVENSTPSEPERFILDGQQRLTSLFQALFLDKAVSTHDMRGNPIKRWYYVDITKAISLNGDREEAIVGIPDDRKVHNFRGEVEADYSSPEKECGAELLPLSILFDTVRLTNWQMCYLQLDPARIHERLARWNALLQTVIQRVQQYQVPLILLRKETPKEAVCQVFEKVNTGGVSLTVFELLTATFAADDYNLREDWATREKRFKKHPALAGVQNTDFLQAIALLATHARRNQSLANGVSQNDAPGISCKRKDILKMRTLLPFVS